KAPNEVSFPHPKPRQNNYGKGDIPNNGRVVWKLCERTVNIAGYRDRKDNVDPAEDRTLGRITHRLIRSATRARGERFLVETHSSSSLAWLDACGRLICGLKKDPVSCATPA